MVTWLARMVIACGKKPAVLTRGYGRKSRVVRMATPSEKWEEAGDEPFLISKSLPGVPVAVSPDRYKGGREVLGYGGADLFILDDGFSHHALKKDLEVVVIDDRRRFGNGKMFPAGILREPIRRLRDADVVIVTKAELPDENFRERIRCFSDAPVLWADFRPVGLVPVGDSGKQKKTEEEGPFLAFCGIADPEAFRLSLERKGIGILELFVFPDHHPYTKTDVDAIMEKASELGAKALVTTEKDAVRWPSESAALPCFALAMEILFLEGEERFQDAVCTLFE